MGSAGFIGASTDNAHQSAILAKRPSRGRDVPAGIRHVAGSEPCTEQEREHHAEPRGLSDWTKPVVGPGSLSRSEDVVRDQEQDVAAKRHLIEPKESACSVRAK